MYQVILYRILLILIPGGLLFLCLLYFIGMNNDMYLKRRKLRQAGREKIKKKYIILFYFLILCIGAVVYFLIIQSKIRGVA